MPIAGAPVSLTPGETVTLSSPIHPGVQNSWQVELDNLSPWTVIAHVSGRTYPIGPSVMRLFTIGSGPADVSIDVPAGGSGGPYQLYSTWAQNPDHIEGTFPSSVGLTSISTGVVDATINGPVTIEGLDGGVNVGVAAYATDLGTQTWTPSSVNVTWTNVPLQTRTLLLTGTSGPFLFTLSGAQSSLQFVTDFGYNVVTPAMTFVAIPVIPGIDSAFQAQITSWGNGVGSGTIRAIAVPDVMRSPLPDPSVLTLKNDNRTGSANATVPGPSGTGPYLFLSSTVSFVTQNSSTVVEGSISWGVLGVSGLLIAIFAVDGVGPSSVCFEHHGVVGPFDSSATEPSGILLTAGPGLLADATFTFVDLS